MSKIILTIAVVAALAVPAFAATTDGLVEAIKVAAPTGGDPVTAVDILVEVGHSRVLLPMPTVYDIVITAEEDEVE